MSQRLINYMSDSCWKKHLQEMLSKKITGNSLKVIGIFKDDDAMDDDTAQLYLDRTLSLHDGIMEKTHMDFYMSNNKRMQMEYILTRTFIIDELNEMYKYPEEYIMEFIMNFQAELELLIKYKDFDNLTEFTQDLFTTMLDYVEWCLKRLNGLKFNKTIEANIKKDHGIK